VLALAGALAVLTVVAGRYRDRIAAVVN
jgi:hypothetical protein